MVELLFWVAFLFLTGIIIVRSRSFWWPKVKQNVSQPFQPKWQWTTGFYKSMHRIHIHIVPENDGDHWEAEDGDCRCKPDKHELDKDTVVYYHKTMTRS